MTHSKISRKEKKKGSFKTRTQTRTNPNTNPNSNIQNSKTYLTENPNNPTSPPHDFRCTFKQREVLSLLEKGGDLTSIARSLGKAKSSIKDRFDSLARKGLVEKNILRKWQLTDIGRKIMECRQFPGKVGCRASGPKSKHANEFTVNIISLPNQWNDGHFYMQCLRAKEFIYNKATDQWYIYYDEATIRISAAKKKMTFWITEQTGLSYEDLMNDVFDKFVEYYLLMSGKGFTLDHVIQPRNEHFADKDGFFAKLASCTTNKGFRIDTPSCSFWVDFSEVVPEEETDDADMALRMEKLAESAMHTHGDFNDLDKVIEISKNNVRAITMLISGSIRQEISKHKPGQEDKIDSGDHGAMQQEQQSHQDKAQQTQGSVDNSNSNEGHAPGMIQPSFHPCSYIG